MSSGRARHSSRIAAPEDSSATCSIRSRNVSSPHWMSSNTTTSGLSAAACSSVLRNAHAISSADVAACSRRAASGSPSAAASSGGRTVELFQHLDHRPIGDPLAVRQAAAADDGRLDRRESSATSRDLPTPASPTIVTSSQRCSACTRSHASRTRRARARGRRTAPVRRSGASPTLTTGRPEPARTCPSARAAATGPTSTAPRDQRQRRLTDQHLTRLAPPPPAAPPR